MVDRYSWSRWLFVVLNYTFLILLAVLCFLPLIHVLAISLSSNLAVSAGLVKLWPKDLTFISYEFILRKSEFLLSLLVTLKRVLLGVAVNMLLTILAAYPLSKESSEFKGRTVYVWILVFTMLFSGGLIPLYMTVKTLGMLDSIWSLILPHALPVFNVVLLLNFFRGIPKELEEAAFIDGAGYMRILWKVYVPLSMPSIATLTLFATVGHWNAWFDGLIFMNSPANYPLQSYLYTIVNNVDAIMGNLDLVNIKLYEEVSSRTAKAAQIFLGALPILLLYPFLQRFFIKGIVVGSVKG
ncbi:ABC transporter permease subunit [Paenibacillus sp. LMG 31461]|uniref:ABC transporter permease subunit n=1 Tax=Paenibacillus plantarum TaxID=2654975 RepID=A0ABX1X2J6_9BACL|nr:carbohydrate ABC transporter permease [Paenibacillus plantarum]NOU62621.1 ABC transporter permease subunit [Paenibacillus plantarum]